MKRILVWDLPTRLFHWLLTVGFFSAAGIALMVGEDGALFPYHAIIGLTIALMVCLRIVWGLVGTRYARIGSFVFGPRATFDYFKGALTGGGQRHIGHNPGSALAIFALLGLVLALAVSGLMLSQGWEGIKEAHQLLAWVTVGVVVVHLAGVMFHSLRHSENITASMFHGRKMGEPSDAIASAHPFAAVVFVGMAGAWAWALLWKFDPNTSTTTLPLLGAELRLGENEAEGSEGAEGHDGAHRNEHREDEYE